MSNIKALVVGGLLGIVATLTGLSAAKADCSQDTAYNTPGFENDSPDHQGLYSNRSDALQASELCEVDGGAFEGPLGWVSYCNTAFELDVCEELSNTIDCAAMSADACDTVMGDIYEGCLALAGITGAVK